MSGEPTLEELLEVQAHLGLPSPALVEKDFYVVRALAAIAALDTQPLRLIFGGGTSLNRAYKLVHRMSEDIDLRIVAEEGSPPRGALRQLRTAVTQALLDAGFDFDPEDRAYRATDNESRRTVYYLPYAPLTRGEGALRPAIKIETAAWPLRRPAVDRPVISFIAEAMNKGPEIASIACASLLETAADKFVALTRRAGAELAGLEEPDATLVRHFHDLHALRAHCDPAEVATLVSEVMAGEIEAYGNKFPAYRQDALGVTLAAVEGLAREPRYGEAYAVFERAMVYGPRASFDACMAIVRELADKISLRPFTGFGR